MRALLTTAAVAMVALTQPALADWEWTRWGMTRFQAFEAAQGKASYASTNDKQRRMYRRGFVPVQVPELVMETRSFGADAQAYLLFDVTSAKLVCVDLIPKQGSAFTPDIRNALTSAYGAPVQEQTKKLPGVEWTTTTWMGEHDTVELQLGGLGSKLKYCERAKEAVAELR